MTIVGGIETRHRGMLFNRPRDPSSYLHGQSSRESNYIQDLTRALLNGSHLRVTRPETSERERERGREGVFLPPTLFLTLIDLTIGSFFLVFFFYPKVILSLSLSLTGETKVRVEVNQRFSFLLSPSSRLISQLVSLFLLRLRLK